MNTYDQLGVTPQSTRAELEEAYQNRRAAYSPAKVAGMGAEIEGLVQLRLAQCDDAYRRLRIALALPPKLTGVAEQRRDRETMIALLVLLTIALGVLGVRDVAVPPRSVAVEQANTQALDAQPAPDFTLATLDGQPVSLSQYTGQVVLVNFWATWCPPCVREIPSLVRLSETYRGQGFVILGVNTTYQDEEAKVAQFVRDNNIPFPVVLDREGITGQAYGSRLMPTSYLIDKQGRIVHTRIGQIDEQTISEQIAVLLAK